MNDGEPPIVADLRRQIEELKRKNDRLIEMLGLQPSRTLELIPAGQSGRIEREVPFALVDRSSSPDLKVEFFQSLFAGRSDVYALRWESERSGKRGWSPAVAGGFAKARSTIQEYLPLTSSVHRRTLGRKDPRWALSATRRRRLSVDSVRFRRAGMGVGRPRLLQFCTVDGNNPSTRALALW